jgi:hypothetical protein
MPDLDKILCEKLEMMAQKIKAVPKMDYHNQPINWDSSEQLLLDHLKPIVVYLMSDEIHRLNSKIKNHHHIVLSVEKGQQYRENGMAIFPSPIEGADSKDFRNQVTTE